VWNQSGRRVLPPLVHKDAVYCGEFSAAGRFIATGAGRIAQVWDATTGEPVTPPFRHSGIVTSVGFHPGGRMLISSTLSGEVFLWDLTPDSRSLDHLRNDAKLRSAHWLDSLGGYTPLSKENLEKLQ
jgi:WD40 repeat protein